MTSDAALQRVRAQRRLRSDGERTRGAILRAAASLATVDGLEGLSIGKLAMAIGMSKSGLYAHFGSKQELQLTTVEEADRIFQEVVVQPALAARPGLARLVAVCEAYFDYLQRGTFPGGCFFAAAALEMGTRPGPVKERVAAGSRGSRRWSGGSRPRPSSSTSFRRGRTLTVSLSSFTGSCWPPTPASSCMTTPTVLDLARQIVHRRLGLGSDGDAGEL